MTFLLPRNFRFVGIIFFIFGLILGVARFYYGFKPDLLDMKMFAFYSSYLETKYMEIIRNNMCEEFIGFFLITGLFLNAFSREKVENKQKNVLRLKACFISAYLNFLFLLVSLFFTYGFAFVYMLMVNMGISLLAYILVFRTLLWYNRSISSDQ
jgi:hypothetical protein